MIISGSAIPVDELSVEATASFAQRVASSSTERHHEFDKIHEKGMTLGGELVVKNRWHFLSYEQFERLWKDIGELS